MDLEGFAFEGEGPPGPDTSFWLSEDSQSHFVSKDYLRCLLDSERIFETSDVTEVPHWVPAPKKCTRHCFEERML